MTRTQLALRRLGGPDAVTWPLFWVSLVASTLFNFAIPPVPIPLAARLPSLALSQLAMFVPLVLLRVGVLNRATRPHPWLVFLSYFVSTAIRAYVLGVMLHLLDGTHDVPFAARLQGSLISVFVVLVLTSLIVSASREHARDQTRLLSLRTELLETREALTGQIEQQNVAALARVQSSLASELERLESASDDQEALSELRRLAGDVVRPMSHELEQSVPSWRPTTAPLVSSRVDWRLVLTGFGDRGPFLPLATTLAITVFIAAGSATYLRDRAVAIVAIALVGPVAMLWVANLLLNRVLPLSSPGRSLDAVVVAALAASALPAAAVAAVSGSSTAAVLGASGTLLLAGLALLLALIRQVFAAQRGTTAELAASTEELRVGLVRLHQAQWYHQRALARALHGAMQSAVVRAAIQLDAAMHDGTVTRALLDQTRVDLAREVDVLSAPSEQPQCLADFIEELESVWSRVATLEVTVDDTAYAAMAHDAVLRAILMEVTSELVSNAMRHGRATRVGISLTQPDAGTLALTVASDSTVDSGPRRQGLGSRLLNDCTLEWRERVGEEGLEVSVLFPTELTPEVA